MRGGTRYIFSISLQKRKLWVLIRRHLTQQAPSNEYLNIHFCVEIRKFSILFVEKNSIHVKIRSILVISNSRGLSKILQDICSSTYQICRAEENINLTTTFRKGICNLTPDVRHILKILWKRGEIAH